MINSVEQYLAELRKALSGADRATVQDALSDAEEYLRTALGNAGPEASAPGGDTLATVIEKYGTPEEIAAAYRQVESLAPPALAVRDDAEPRTDVAPSTAKDGRSWFARFFGIFAEPRAWGSLFYLLFAFVTGIIYFTWAVTGLSTSLSLLILVIGLPVAGLFLLSVKGIALVEGRIVEALLGVRMPRRRRFHQRDTGIWQRFKDLIADRHTWFSIIYMLLQMPLGTIYFTVFVTLLSASLGLMFWPIASMALGEPIVVVGVSEYYARGWLIPLSLVLGFLLLTITMHLVKITGRGHGVLAKTLLVRP